MSGRERAAWRTKLRVHRKAQAAERLEAGPAHEDHGLVFADELGRPLSPDAQGIYQHVRRDRLVDAAHRIGEAILG